MILWQRSLLCREGGAQEVQAVEVVWEGDSCMSCNLAVPGQVHLVSFEGLRKSEGALEVSLWPDS